MKSLKRSLSYALSFFVAISLLAGIAAFDVYAMDDTPEDDTAEFERDGYGQPIRNTSEDMPVWFPEDTSQFVEYHDSYIPRVIDIADIFSSDEEEAIKERIADVSSQTGKDIVIVTDITTYGMSREQYCYDFYDYCGYGFGDSFDGMCLFICMDPQNRGWIASATGVVEDLYTEETANDMDDVLYEYMAAGDYAEGVIDWVGNMYTLYTRGVPFAPEWLPTAEELQSFVRAHDRNITRIYDSAKVFTEEERRELQDKIDKIIDAYDIDVVVHTTSRTYHMIDTDYADAFYMYNGYGRGTDYSGMLLTIVTGEERHIIMTVYGEAALKCTDVNFDRIWNQSWDQVHNFYYFYGAERFVDNAEHMFRTGRVNKTTGAWIGRAVFAVIVGLIAGIWVLSGEESKMKTVAAAFNADKYMDGSQRIVPVKDTFIKEYVTKTRIVHHSSDSGGSSRSSSSGRSSYSSHSSGSSGRSHTSSGRNF